MEKLTIFTPTYNRAYILNQCYQSLKRQTNKNFIWLVIDDGSEDHTRSLVEGWMQEHCDFKIDYIYKENGGMHTAHNIAYENSTTELTMCIDSDDYLADDAVEIILNQWNEFANEKYAGMVGLDSYTDGTIVGMNFPQKLKSSKFQNIHRNYKGDKKYIYRTAVFNNYPPYPVFENEKFTPLSLKYYLMDDKYELLLINKVLCYVEYLQDGSSKNIIESYRKNPRGFSELRKVTMIMESNPIRKFISAIQYVMSNIMIKNRNFIIESPKKLITVFAIPFGIMMHLYISRTKRKQLNSKLK